MLQRTKRLILPLLCAASLSLHAQNNGPSTGKADSLRIVELEEVQIVSTRATSKTPVAYSNVDKKSIAKVNYGQDIPYLLTLTPSVVATSDAGTGIGYTGFRVRGSDASRINITSNGVPLNDSESQSVFWVNMPDFASSVEDLQVQRGVGTSSNGAGAFGASINMRTENLSHNRYGQFDLSGGSFGTLRRALKLGTGRMGGRWTVDARLSRITSDGYVDRADVDLNAYFAQAGYYGDNTIVKLIAFGGKEKTGIAWNGLSKSDEEKYGSTYNSAGFMYLDADGKPKYYHNTDNYNQQHQQAIVNHRFSDRATLNFTLHHTSGFGFTDEYRTGRKLKEYGLQPFVDANGNTVKKVSLIRKKFLDNDFYGAIASLDWKLDPVKLQLGASANHYEGDHYGQVNYIDKYPQTLDPKFEYYRNNAKKFDMAYFIKANWQANELINLYGDIQYRHIGYQIDGIGDEWDDVADGLQQISLDKKFNFLNPKAGILFQFDPQQRAYASVGVAHREPNRTNYTEAGAGQYPQAERLIDYELGYHYSSPSWSLSAGLYYMDYKDQLVMDGRLSDVGQMLTSNVPNSYRMGIELSSSLSIIPKHLRWDMTLALSRNKIKEYTQTTAQYVVSQEGDYEWVGNKEEQLTNTDIAYSPSIVASSVLSYQIEGFEAAWTARFVGKQYLDNTQREDRSLPSYFLNDLRLAYQFAVLGLKNVGLGLQLNNLFGLRYASNAYIYDAGYTYTSAADAANGTNQGAYADLRRYPQAGFSLMGSLSIRF